jgi:hypothetical protein
MGEFELYARLVSNPDHVAAVLAMMANWDLDSLASDQVVRVVIPQASRSYGSLIGIVADALRVGNRCDARTGSGLLGSERQI